jgi:hypothetical protein
MIRKDADFARQAHRTAEGYRTIQKRIDRADAERMREETERHAAMGLLVRDLKAARRTAEKSPIARR